MLCPVPVIKHLTLSTNYRIQRIRHLQIPQKKHRKPQKQWKKAAQATDYWTDAVGNYDKGCLEAVYSTEELVNMGFKTEDALKAEADAAEEAQDKTEQLGEEMDKTSKKSEDFGDKSKNAVVGLDDILATVGIVAALNKIEDAFSNASDKAAEFETNVAMVSTVADTTVLSADQLATQISGLSKDTAKNVNELADATYNAISAGVATEGAVETVGEASKLATAGFDIIRLCPVGINNSPQCVSAGSFRGNEYLG